MKILAYRFSAMGDVALCLPVVKAALALNPQLEMTFVTRPSFAFIFKDIPRLKVVVANFEGEHRGIGGLFQLSKKLKNEGQYDYICDFHQVLRSHFLNFLFTGTKVFKIEKDRSGKKQFLRSPSSQYLKHTTLRYLDVMRPLGLTLPTKVSELLSYGYTSQFSNKKTEDLIEKNKGKKIIGIAPFARHFTKIWPYEYLQELLIKLKATDVTILLFGGPEDEKMLSPLEQLNERVVNLAGVYNLEEELALMKKLQLMIAMDSANMHFAGLCNVPTLSIWGGTHPGFGFYPLDPKAEILEVPVAQINCRPCSLFGQASCPKQHFDCMNKITPDLVFERIQKYI